MKHYTEVWTRMGKGGIVQRRGDRVLVEFEPDIENAGYLAGKYEEWFYTDEVKAVKPKPKPKGKR